MEPAEDIKKEILKRYDSNPSGWRVFVGRDRRGHFDLVISHDSDMWLIKEEQINPFRSVGFGVRDKVVGFETIERISPYTFGLRPLSERQMMKVALALRSNESPSKFLARVLRTEPVASTEITSPGVLQGPVIHSARGIELISERQAELDRELRLELERLLTRKYPQTIAPYM